MGYSSRRRQDATDRPLTVCCIAWDDQQREAVSETLREADFTVDTAETPSEWRRTRESTAYDAIVSAVEFPDENGQSLLAEPNDPRAPPVVFFGQTPDAGTLQSLLNSGAARFVDWPDGSDRDELVSATRTIATGHRTRVQDRADRLEYERILDNLQEGFYRTDATGTLTMATPAIADMLGYDSPEVFVGEDVMKFYPDDADRELLDALQRNDGEVTNFEAQLVDCDGQTVDVLTSSHFFYEEGEVVGVEGIFRDITSRKETERALRESRERLSAIYESSPTAITLSSLPTGEFVEVNEAFTEITGWSASEAIGASMSELHVWDEEADRRALFETLKETGTVSDFEFPFRTKDGSRGTALTSGEIVTIDDQEYLLSTTLDITDRVRRQQESTLLQQVLSRLLRHNLRNDLTVIRSRAELIPHAAPEEVADHAETIVEKASDLRETSEKARRIEGIIEGRPARAEQDLRGLVQHLVDELDREFPDATVRTDLTQEARVRAADGLDLAIEDAIQNAIVHNDTDPTVEVSLERTDEHVVFEVTDDGPGIPQSELDVLDEGEETDLQHGTGAGLWLMHWVVEKSDGDLIFETTGKGTTLRMRFQPVADDGTTRPTEQSDAS